MIETPIHDRLLREFKSLHYGRVPGTDPIPTETMRRAALAMTGVARAAEKATTKMTASMTVMKAAQKKASQPRDPRLRTTGRTRR